MKSSEVGIKIRSPPASLPIQGQVTKYTNVKWAIVLSFTMGAICYIEQVKSRFNSNSRVFKDTKSFILTLNKVFPLILKLEGINKIH